MKRALASTAILALVFSTSPACFADFQYTENSKVTGGAMAGMTKFLGAFSKDAKQATQPTTSTISVKGNRMRREDSLGKVELIDLDGRRFIHLDLKNKTYSVLTFEQMRAQLEEAKKKAAEQQAKHGHGQDPQVTLKPKIEVTQGTGVKQLLNYSAKEVKTRVEMEMQSQDPKQQGSASMWMTADSWVAPVKGYDEIKRFYLRMAQELDWVPGAVLGANPQMNVASVELRKSTAKLTGLPLLQYTSMGMGAISGSNTGAGQQPQQNSASHTSTSPAAALGGLFGKKKKDDSGQQENSGSGSPGSLMDMTTEVTSVSASALDASLFEIPAGFKQVEGKKSPTSP
jgi:hypothetical protein